MTDEELNRKFDIVAGHLATLSVKVDKLAEKTDALAEAQHRAEDRWSRTEESIRALLTISQIQSQEIKDLGDGLRVVDARQRQADERQRETNERLNALMNIVEKDISERRNRRNGEKRDGE